MIFHNICEIVSHFYNTLYFRLKIENNCEIPKILIINNYNRIYNSKINLNKQLAIKIRFIFIYCRKITYAKKFKILFGIFKWLVWFCICSVLYSL